MRRRLLVVRLPLLVVVLLLAGLEWNGRGEEFGRIQLHRLGLVFL
jgi:hypothetical protein